VRLRRAPVPLHPQSASRRLDGPGRLWPAAAVGRRRGAGPGPRAPCCRGHCRGRTGDPVAYPDRPAPPQFELAPASSQAYRRGASPACRLRQTASGSNRLQSPSPRILWVRQQLCKACQGRGPTSRPRRCVNEGGVGNERGGAQAAGGGALAVTGAASRAGGRGSRLVGSRQNGCPVEVRSLGERWDGEQRSSRRASFGEPRVCHPPPPGRALLAPRGAAERRRARASAGQRGRSLVVSLAKRVHCDRRGGGGAARWGREGISSAESRQLPHTHPALGNGRGSAARPRGARRTPRDGCPTEVGLPKPAPASSPWGGIPLFGWSAGGRGDGQGAHRLGTSVCRRAPAAGSGGR
jgi:hypothetical protein